MISNPLQNPSRGQVLTSQGAGENPVWAEEGGANTFLELSDTPNSYSGQAGKITQVNPSEDGLEFIDKPKPLEYVEISPIEFSTDVKGAWVTWATGLPAEAKYADLIFVSQTAGNKSYATVGARERRNSNYSRS